MDIQFLTVLITILAANGFVWKELKNFQKEIREDVKTQSARSDQLYQIIVDLLRDKK